MVFSSATFVFLFLPLTFLITLATPKAWQNAVLLFASLIFYGWGEPIFIVAMIFSGFINYLFALKIAGNKKLLILNIIFNIGMLGFFKYTDFLIHSLNAVTDLSIPLAKIPLPVGISFYTFQTMSYVIDVYRHETKAQKNFLNVLLYITFFPQLIAGPIVVYKDIEERLLDRRMTIDGVSNGLVRFVTGLTKKLIIANTMAVVVDQLYAQQQFGTAAAWIAGTAYLLQIYFDFSGYSDMAIGMGAMFGFHFKENFNYPYIAQSIQDFWRRWHISLSSWFRDYLYIPLGGNRQGPIREIINKLIVFFITGLWHGAAWTFVIWGLYHGLFLLIEKLFLKTSKWPKLLKHVYTLLVVLVGFVIFRAESFTQAGVIIRDLFIYTPTLNESLGILQVHLTPYYWSIFALGLLFSTPIAKRFILQSNWRYAVSAVLWILCMLSISSASYNPFIYFRF